MRNILFSSKIEDGALLGRMGGIAPVLTHLPRKLDSIDGIFLDDQGLNFTNANILEALHRAATNSRKIRNRHWPIGPYDCVDFATDMAGVRPFLGLNGRGHPLQRTVSDWFSIDKEDIDGPIDYPVVIGRDSNTAPFVPIHVLYPAHLNEGKDIKSAYLQKMDSEGQICLSGLSWAMSFYKCNSAFEIYIR